MALSVAQVLLDTPLPQLDHLFDYAIPELLSSDVVVGGRVRVPLRMGNRRVDAHVIHIIESSSFSGALQDIDSVITSVPVLPHGLYELARRVADRQAGSASDVLRLAIPSRFVRVEKAFFTEEAVVARAHAHATRNVDAVTSISGAEQLVSERVAEIVAPFAGLESGQCRSVAMPPGVTAWGGVNVPTWALAFALEARRIRSSGQSVIFVLPSYRDIDDVVSALLAVGEMSSVVRADARQTGGERYAGYLRILEPQPVIVVGNRSAVYAPAHDVGLIGIWDDGDTNLQEPLAPYAHPRDVALLASQSNGARVILAGFAVSVEAQRLVDIKFASAWSAPRSALPRIVPTDSLTSEQSRARIPSAAWAHAREQSQIGPVLVQVARPGYAPSLCCATCRTRAVCSSCSGPLSTRASGTVPNCRWCGQLVVQWRCTECSGTKLRLTSSGTERTAEELGRAFPGTRVIVSDGAHSISRIEDEPCVVVATPGAEPMAVNGYRCVLVLDGESHRSRAGLRVDENAVRLWINALSLATAGATCFLVGAGHDLGAVIASWRLREFASAQLAQRQAIGLPPAKRAATLVGFTADVLAAVEAVSTIGHTRVMGPTTVEDESRAIVLFDYRDGDAVSTALRASVVKAATKGARRRSATSKPERVVRLRVRLDDAELEDSV